MEKIYKHCQSCGMPMKRDELGGGTNSDGSKSLMYCSHCFQDGAFTRTNITAQQMQAFCIEKMVEMKIPRLFARFFARTVPHLERWKN